MRKDAHAIDIVSCMRNILQPIEGGYNAMFLESPHLLSVGLSASVNKVRQKACVLI